MEEVLNTPKKFADGVDLNLGSSATLENVEALEIPYFTRLFEDNILNETLGTKENIGSAEKGIIASGGAEVLESDRKKTVESGGEKTIEFDGMEVLVVFAAAGGGSGAAPPSIFSPGSPKDSTPVSG